MRILMLSQFYPPVLGGLERHVKDLSEALVTRGHQVAVITLHQSGWGQDFPEYDEQNGVRIYRVRSTVSRAEKILFVDERRSYAPPFPDPELALSIRRILLLERPEIIHAHNWISFSFLPWKSWSKAKLVVTLHEFGLACGKWTYIHKDAFCSGPNFAKCAGCLTSHYGLVKGTVTLAGSTAMRAWQNNVVDCYLPVSQAVAEGSGLVNGKAPYRVVPNFIPDEYPRMAELPSEVQKLLPSGKFILFVGSFSRQKGLDILLDAFRGVDTPASLVCVGYEIREFPLEKIDLPENVLILKNLANPVVQELWRRSIFGVVPSNWPEPSPTVVMEAMSAGKPVIASNVGGIPDILDESSGILVPPGDPAALRSALIKLLADDRLREIMGKYAMQKVKSFQAGRVVAKIESIYRELVKSPA